MAYLSTLLSCVWTVLPFTLDVFLYYSGLFIYVVTDIFLYNTDTKVSDTNLCSNVTLFLTVFYLHTPNVWAWMQYGKRATLQHIPNCWGWSKTSDMVLVHTELIFLNNLIVWQRRILATLIWLGHSRWWENCKRSCRLHPSIAAGFRPQCMMVFFNWLSHYVVMLLCPYTYSILKGWLDCQWLQTSSRFFIIHIIFFPRFYLRWHSQCELFHCRTPSEKKLFVQSRFALTVSTATTLFPHSPHPSVEIDTPSIVVL